MPNILINPNTGIIEFNTGIAGSAVFDTNLSGLRMTYDNFGALNLLSYNTNTSSGLDRFTIDGTNGRLFSVTDNLVGSLFSVNDIAGLPIIEAFDDNTIVMGAFNRNDFIITGGCVGIGGLPNTGFTKLLVNGAISGLSGIFGQNNSVINTAGAFIGGGCNNLICKSSTYAPNNSSIVGGMCNTITCYADNSFIGGGTGNIVNASCFGVIGGGCSNCVSAVVGGGYDFNFIGNGRGNCIGITPLHSTILNGRFNCMQSACYSTIINGCCNCTTASNNLINGSCNYLQYVYSFAHGLCNSGLNSYTNTFGGANKNEGYSSSILGGLYNKIIGAFSEYSVVVGGTSNCIGTLGGGTDYSSKNSFIGGGIFNYITGNVSSSECGNITMSSTIVGGANNAICSDYSAILGGRCNRVGHHGATLIGDGASRIKRSAGPYTLTLDFIQGISLANNTLFDATPQILTVNNNFNITTGYNSRMILVNSPSAPVTGFLTSGQVNGFNASLIQIGAGQIQITGSGIGITFNSYNNQYKSAGQYSTISVLHTGNNGYIMYGNTTL